VNVADSRKRRGEGVYGEKRGKRFRERMCAEEKKPSQSEEPEGVSNERDRRSTLARGGGTGGRKSEKKERKNGGLTRAAKKGGARLSNVGRQRKNFLHAPSGCKKREEDLALGQRGGLLCGGGWGLNLKGGDVIPRGEGSLFYLQGKASGRGGGNAVVALGKESREGVEDRGKKVFPELDDMFGGGGGGPKRNH